MKSKKIIIMFLIAMLSLILFATKSNAAIQIKEGATRHANISVNDMFDNCYNLKNQASTLGNNNLDPHMCNARDWGAMWYLGMSSYGSASLGVGVGITGKSFHSLSGNMSGVMYDTSNEPGHAYNAAISTKALSYANSGYNSNLYSDKNKKYVDVVSEASINDTLGMALQEVKTWTNGGDNFSGGTGNPVLYRIGSYGTYTGSNKDRGAANTNYTYRPVIWN